MGEIIKNQHAIALAEKKTAPGKMPIERVSNILNHRNRTFLLPAVLSLAIQLQIDDRPVDADAFEKFSAGPGLSAFFTIILETTSHITLLLLFIYAS